MNQFLKIKRVQFSQENGLGMSVIANITIVNLMQNSSARLFLSPPKPQVDGCKKFIVYGKDLQGQFFNSN